MQQLILIKTIAELNALREYLLDKSYIAYDTETTGLSKEAKIIGFSIAAETDIAYYVILRAWNKEKQILEDLETEVEAKSFLEFLSKKDLIMHNAIFDCKITDDNYKVNLINSLHTDTMILAHLLDEERAVGLKELGTAIFGEDAKKEQIAMKTSILENGGKITKKDYELYKADAELIGKYGAKDAILTLNLFYHLVPKLYEEQLDKFFYEEESMPLLKGPTYDLNTAGLKIDIDGLLKLKGELESECMEAKAFVYEEIKKHVSEKYPGTKPSNTFNIGSSKQLAWLLFGKLNNEFLTLTKGGKELCKAMDIPVPYKVSAKKEFITMCQENLGVIYEEAKFNYKTGKMSRPKKIGEPWNYIACGKESLARYSSKYKWAAKLLEYAKNLKLLNTYVEGIKDKLHYGIIYPSFLQHGTTSGRYSSRHPNFQNLPRRDTRIKKCIVARPGKVLVGADQSQLEPRVFAYFSGDKRLMECFSNDDDFYSVIGIEVFDKKGLSLKKDEPNSFAKKHNDLRDVSKVVGLSATYGTTAFKMAPAINRTTEEAQDVIDKYFIKFPDVQRFMLQCHKDVKEHGYVKNLFGRPRRLPEALKFDEIYGESEHSKLPYPVRNILNLSVNHKIQSTGASIMNRAAIACHAEIQKRSLIDKRWLQVKIVLQVHDELVLEGPKELELGMCEVLKFSMENTVTLKGVGLIAIPKAGYSLAELK